jgi:hypothetical protein
MGANSHTTTWIKRLFLGDKGSSAVETLTDGDMEIQNDLYVKGILDVNGATDFASTVAVTGVLTATGGISVAKPLVVASTLFGRNVFNGTSTSDEVTLSGVLSGDTILAFPYGSSVNESGDTLSCAASSTGGAFTVYRDSGGTSGLTYAYLVLRAA